MKNKFFTSEMEVKMANKENEGKVYEISDNELETVSAGASGSTQGVGGMPCPACGYFIPITMYQIMELGSIYCPCCGLRLDINKQASAKAIEALKTLGEAQR